MSVQETLTLAIAGWIASFPLPTRIAIGITVLLLPFVLLYWRSSTERKAQAAARFAERFNRLIEKRRDDYWALFLPHPETGKRVTLAKFKSREAAEQFVAEQGDDASLLRMLEQKTGLKIVSLEPMLQSPQGRNFVRRQLFELGHYDALRGIERES